jgi:hypothetical protein
VTRLLTPLHGGLAVVLLASAFGLRAQPTTPMTSRFDAGEVAWSRESGTATVEGSASITPPGGGRQTCAGGEAQLVPASAHAAEMMRIVFGNDARGFAPLATARYPTNVSPDFGKTVRRIGCDAQGRFRFDNVPAGRWYVFSNVVYRAAGGDAEPQGGALMQGIEVAQGARVDVALAP